MAFAATLLLCTSQTNVFADPIASQASRAATAARSRDRPIEVSLFGLHGSTSFAARETFDAVLGTASGQVAGGGGEVRFLRGWLKGVFARVDASRFRERGQRVFVFEGEIFELGIPLTVTLTPVELTAGYRYRFRATSPVAPYAGIGVGTVQYREESGFAEPGENVSERFTSYHALAGVDVRVWRGIGVGLEGHYRSVPDGLGAGGVSKEVNETNLGGATIRVKVGVTF